MNHLGFFAFGTVALFTLVFQVCEREPNDLRSEATTLDVPGYFERGVLAVGRLAPGDVDHFSFEAHAGDVLTLALRDDGQGEVADAVVAVYGPAGDEPLAFVDDVGRSLSPRLSVPVATSGLHTIAVSGFGDSLLDGGGHRERFAYRLAVTRSHELVEYDRRGRNDDPRWPSLQLLHRAQLRPRGVAAVAGSLTPGDVDHYLVPLVPHAVVTATIYDDADGEFNDPVLVLMDRDQEVLARDDDAGPGRLPRIVYRAGDAPGVALLAVDGYDADGDPSTPHEEDFDYRLVVSVEDVLSAR